MKTATISLYIDESGSCCTLYDGDQTGVEELPEEFVAVELGGTGKREEIAVCSMVINKALLLAYQRLLLDDSFVEYPPEVTELVRFVSKEKKREVQHRGTTHPEAGIRERS